ncbi:MAG: carbamoyltransferase N-terminal domain-containing protein [Pseudonocardiaceae bacterium]
MEDKLLIGGIKLTQSGGLALLEENNLIFNTEVQKLDNNSRYSDVRDLRILPEMLSDFGYQPPEVDHWVIDGWDGAVHGHVSLFDHGTPIELTVAPYRETARTGNPALPAHTGKIRLGGKATEYISYVHVASHLAAAYCTSPFARRKEPSFVLVWDGGCFPRLYYVNELGLIEPGGEAFPLIGHFYSMTSQYWGPLRRPNKSTHVDDLSAAGKLMAYIALGTAKAQFIQVFRELFYKHFEANTTQVHKYREAIIGCGSTGERSHSYVHAYLEDTRTYFESIGAADEDILASAHKFIEELLLDRISAKIHNWKGHGPWNLCFAGGCALNIKWNSALRTHPCIAAMWVPPFPDDSGSAIGTACLRLGNGHGLQAITWNPRLGPALIDTAQLSAGWSARPCGPEQLAQLLHEDAKPVVLLNGRAELGPRALGARSIVAPAIDPRMKDLLNEVKRREYYRPVAPICLTESAPEIFDPGTPDPHMLFEHRVRPQWVDRIPAVLHLDGTARLQTVSDVDDPNLAAILRAYRDLSGIPVLCNTSANYSGRSFFPDAASAMEWGMIDRVWVEGTLYEQLSSAD